MSNHFIRLITLTLICVSTVVAQRQSSSSKPSPPKSARVTPIAAGWHIFTAPDNDFVVQFPAEPQRDTEIKTPVRARFLTNLVENAFEREFEKLGSVPDLTSVLLPVAQIAGHNNVETLQPYLAVAKKRLLLRTIAERAASAEGRAVSAERRLKTTLAKLKATKLLGDIASAIESGNKKRIITALHKLQDLYP